MQLEFLKFIQEFKNPVLDLFFEGITMLGEEAIVILLCGVMFWCIDKKFGYILSITALTNVMLNSVLKGVFKTKRPIGFDGIESKRVATAKGSSFPSGHTQNFTALATAIANKLKTKQALIAATALSVLVAFSRLYLGVHWPIDVIAGLIFGFGWALIAEKLFELMEQHGLKFSIFIAIVFSLGVIFAELKDYYKLLGSFYGLIIGFEIERKYVKHVITKDTKERVLRIIVGLLGVVLVKVVFKSILPVHVVSDILRYALMVSWVVCGAPYAFKKIEKKTILQEQ